jgi:uncharacterized protein (TIGR02246 family)
MRRSLLLLSLAAGAACTSKPATTTDSAAMTDTGAAAATTAQSADDAKAAIGKIRDGWKAAADKKDNATVASYYTDDAEFVGSDGPPAKGRAAIEKAFGTALPMTMSTTIDSHDLQVQGDMAYDYGEYTQEINPPKAKPKTEHGYYVVVLRRQSDGSWKIVRHVSTVPPTM